MFTSILRITQNETILTILNSHTELGLPVIVTVKAGFNSDGVRVGVVIKSVGLNDLVKTAF